MRLVTLYKTSSPGVSIKSGEYYQLALDNPDGRGFILKESHGNCDGVKGEKVPGGSSEILSPPDGYLSSEEGKRCLQRAENISSETGFPARPHTIFNPEILTPGEI